MLFALLNYLNEYWYLIVFLVFGILMFVGRRIDPIIDNLAERKMRRIHGDYTKKYSKELFDYNEFLSNILGVEVKLDDLMKSVYEINEKIFKDELVRVTYLELWILVKVYGVHMVKSDEHVYYINKKHFIPNLELELKDVNRWANEFANSKQIRSLKMEAGFTLHKIRTNDPRCNPKISEFGLGVETVVFEKDYLLSSRERIKGELNNEIGIVELEDGLIVEFDNSGVRYVGKKDDMSIDDKIGLTVTNELENKVQDVSINAKDIKPQEKAPVSKEKNEEEKIETLSDGSVKKYDEGNREYVFRSDLKSMEKEGANPEDVISEDDCINLDTKIAHAKEELIETLIESITVEKPAEEMDVSFFAPKENKEEEKEKELVEDIKNFVKGATTEVQNKKVQPSSDDKKKVKSINPRKYIDSLTKKDFDTFLVDLENGEHANILDTFFLFDKNEIYWDEINQKHYISAVHFLNHLVEYYIEESSMVAGLFDGAQFHAEAVDKILEHLGKTNAQGFEFGKYKNKVFQRADEGYMESYPFSEISNYSLEYFPDKIVRGKISKRSANTKYKAFVQQFLELDKLIS